MHRCTIFFDLSTFYERVSHERLVEEAAAWQFPPLLLNLGMEAYRGGRLVTSDSVASPCVYATRGIVAGCPLAPTLSKLAIGKPVVATCSGPSVDFVGTWIDDVSADVVHKSADRAAADILSLFRRLNQALEADGNEVSASKTHFLASSAEAERALKRKLGKHDPPVRQTTKDLGMETAAGRRRTTFQSAARRHKAGRRLARLKALRGPSLKVRSRLFSMSVLASGNWGHQAQGVSPKIMKSIRLQAALLSGKVTTGSVEVALELGGPLVKDPRTSIVAQHWAAVSKVICALPDREQLERTWSTLWKQLQRPDRWKVVAGPIGAMVSYLLELRIGAESPRCWEFDAHLSPATMAGKQLPSGRVAFDPLDPLAQHAIKMCLMAASEMHRQEAISHQTGCEDLRGGIDTTVPRQLAKARKTSLRKGALSMVWQGAMRSRHVRPGEVCPLCRVPLTPLHMAQDCAWWRGRAPPPPANWAKLRATYPFESLWTRGLLPATATRLRGYVWGPESEEATGAATAREWSPEHLYGTDGTAGAHGRDPRGRIAAWAVVIFRRTPTGVEQIGAASGVLPPGTSVPQAEAYAVARVCSRTPGKADVTTDCLGTLKQQRAHNPTWPWVQAGERRHHASLTWVRSHVSEEAFCSEFGSAQLWRRELNEAADTLCKQAAARAATQTAPWCPDEADELVREVTQFLQHRAAVLLKSQERPPWDLQSEAATPRRTKALKPQQGPKERPPQRQNRPAADGGLNKKERILLLVTEGGGGHSWELGTAKSTSASCSRCSLYIEQIFPLWKFDRIARHTCIHIECPLPQEFEVHESHDLHNLGCKWVCKKCGAQLGPGATKVTKLLTSRCKPTRLSVSDVASRKLSALLPSETSSLPSVAPKPAVVGRKAQAKPKAKPEAQPKIRQLFQAQDKQQEAQQSTPPAPAQESSPETTTPPEPSPHYTRQPVRAVGSSRAASATGPTTSGLHKFFRARDGSSQR